MNLLIVKIALLVFVHHFNPQVKCGTTEAPIYHYMVQIDSTCKNAIDTTDAFKRNDSLVTVIFTKDSEVRFVTTSDPCYGVLRGVLKKGNGFLSKEFEHTNGRTLFIIQKELDNNFDLSDFDHSNQELKYPEIFSFTQPQELSQFGSCFVAYGRLDLNMKELVGFDYFFY
jgi:hypothetical protein